MDLIDMEVHLNFCFLDTNCKQKNIQMLTIICYYFKHNLWKIDFNNEISFYEMGKK